ncbi:MAG: enoyl-CoA hydratase/isomerase family protein [Deltaproteobacteria bacterium]|nr:enoyl-CoA hydratase/isomerase family protein [Deltaproteobacteria bacterium]MBN2844918.1 enoyl-CoA hydratase/isomerase family protein [Deltaproteobacteria bacterium]
MDYKNIAVEKREGYAVVTLDRPREMNALTKAMRRELDDCFEMLEKDTSVNAVILTGGDAVFSAGMDLVELSQLPEGELDDYISSIIRCLERIYTFRKPVVAAVSGIALGGGFNIAVICDLIVASETAIFGHPELKFGLNPLFDPLRRIVGVSKAKEITMLGEPIAAKEALRIGLVNKVAPPEKFMEEAEIIVRELSKRPAKALEAVKRISDIVPRLDKSTALEHEFEIAGLLFSRAERKECMEKFLGELKSRKKK